jgi:RNA polymerase sigma-70 factor, ECF subfamily
MSISTSTNATRASLLVRAIERDETAWRQLVDLYGPLVAYWCRSFRLDSHTTADIVQDVFIAVSRSIGSFRSNPGSGAFRGWLWKITRNKLIDWKKQNQNWNAIGGSSARRIIESVAEGPLDEEPTDQIAMDGLLHRALMQIRIEFQESTWTAFWRSAIDGISSNLVASELGISPAGVRQARARITRRLRAYLNEDQNPV